MSGKLAAGLGLAVLLAAVYLLAWPVPIDPVAWDAPEDEGLTGAFSPNEMLSFASAIDIEPHAGPEDIVFGAGGILYASVHDGRIVAIRSRRAVDVFAQTGGRPLGIDVAADGSLVVANAFLGLQRVAPDGRVDVLLDSVEGIPLRYANDVAVAADGRIYLTESSRKFGAGDAGDTLAASLLDIVEHGGHGALIEYDPRSQAARVLLAGLDFPNGVALSQDERFLVIAETGSYRILRYWLEGDRRGETEVLRDNLPGFPDNVNAGLNGRFWIGLVNPRNALLDRYSGHPFLRKILQRLPRSIRPRPVRSSHVIAIDGSGEVLMNLLDPRARYPMLTGALETRERLYFSTLTGSALPWIDKRNLL